MRDSRLRVLFGHEFTGRRDEKTGRYDDDRPIEKSEAAFAVARSIASHKIRSHLPLRADRPGVGCQRLIGPFGQEMVRFCCSANSGSHA